MATADAFHAVSEEIYTGGDSQTLAPSLLVAFYDKQRIRLRYFFVMPDIGNTAGHNKIRVDFRLAFISRTTTSPFHSGK